MLASGSPDFPFALCWANEEWTRNWDARRGQVLMPQEYSDEDDLAHIRWLATAFADDRYIKIDGRPLLLVYRPGQLPDPRRTTDDLAGGGPAAGFPDLYLCWVESWGPPPGGPEAFGLDATVGFMPLSGERVFAPLEGIRGHRILDYRSAYEASLQQLAPPWKRFPSVMVGWDNTARRPHGATIFAGATPERLRARGCAGRRLGQRRSARRRTTCSSWPGTSGPRATTSSPTSATDGPSSRPPGPCCWTTPGHRAARPGELRAVRRRRGPGPRPTTTSIPSSTRARWPTPPA